MSPGDTIEVSHNETFPLSLNPHLSTLNFFAGHLYSGVRY
jgi:hypothetical protein